MPDDDEGRGYEIDYFKWILLNNSFNHILALYGKRINSLAFFVKDEQ